MAYKKARYTHSLELNLHVLVKCLHDASVIHFLLRSFYAHLDMGLQITP